MPKSTKATLAPQQTMAALIERLAPSEGFTLSALDGVRLMRSNRSLPRTPVLYEPSICIVCQGRKRGYLGEETYVYDAQQFLVLSVPLPFECETQARSGRTFPRHRHPRRSDGGCRTAASAG